MKSKRKHEGVVFWLQLGCCVIGAAIIFMNVETSKDLRVASGIIIYMFGYVGGQISGHVKHGHGGEE